MLSSAERPGYLILLRKHVSRRVADNVQGMAVLEGVGFDDATKARFFADNPNVEPAVQAGLTKWSGGQGRPPTWQVLCEAMEYADMEDSHIGDLKMALMNPTSALPGGLQKNMHMNRMGTFILWVLPTELIGKPQ